MSVCLEFECQCLVGDVDVQLHQQTTIARLNDKDPLLGGEIDLSAAVNILKEIPRACYSDIDRLTGFEKSPGGPHRDRCNHVGGFWGHFQRVGIWGRP